MPLLTSDEVVKNIKIIAVDDNNDNDNNNDNKEGNKRDDNERAV